MAVYGFNPRSGIEPPPTKDDVKSLPAKRRAEAELADDIIARHEEIW